MERIYQVVVNGLKGERITIDLGNSLEAMNNMTVLQLKKKLAEKLPGNSGNDLSRLGLIFADDQLEDSRRLSTYGIQDKSVLHLVLQLPGGRGGAPLPTHSAPEDPAFLVLAFS